MEKLRKDRDAVAKERDRLIRELEENQKSLREAAAILKKSEAALKAARKERDEWKEKAAEASALAGADSRLRSVTRRLAEALNHAAELERERDDLRKEVAALRAALAGGALAPRAGEEGKPSPASVREGSSAETVSAPPVALTKPGKALLNINRAGFDELAAVSGIGPSRARAIIWYREQVGPITDFETLRRVPGFNEARIKRLRGVVGFGEEEKK
ncbi:MAG: hypothetical protein D6679_13745 [Candidatus Hydrogenedentota bacterium]|nr:MAG: hypothetical protein D6679_13745 [Candidatus Hydrogenedentota bacterium]